jgi:hypothetical protein
MPTGEGPGERGLGRSRPLGEIHVVALPDGRPALEDARQRRLDRLLGTVLVAGHEIGEAQQPGHPCSHPLVELAVLHNHIHTQLTRENYRLLQRHSAEFVQFCSVWGLNPAGAGSQVGIGSKVAGGIA